LSLAHDAETELLRSQLQIHEWIPLWTYGNALREEGNDELETLFPSFHIGSFWSSGRFGLSHFSLDDGPERALVFPSGADSGRHVLGELYFVCFDVWFGMDFTAVDWKVGEVTGVRLLSWPTAVWALVGPSRIHDLHRWNDCEHDHRCGVAFEPDTESGPQPPRRQNLFK
jgi:hypothetical protein